MMPKTPISNDEPIRAAHRYWAAGKLAEAEAVCRSILVDAPEHTLALQLLGAIAEQVGRLDVACNLFGRAAALNPSCAETQSNFSYVLNQEGRFDEAISVANEAIRLNPCFAPAYNNLGRALLALGHTPAAIEACQRALMLDPNSAFAAVNLGNALARAGRSDEAIDSYHQALRIEPRLPAAHNNLGVALTERGQVDQAIDCFQRALSAQPADADTHLNLGGALFDCGRLDEAMDAYRRAMVLNPGDSTRHSNLISAMHFHPACDAAAIRRETSLWNERFAKPLRGLRRPHTNTRDPERRLRVGYVSPNFYDHVVVHAILPLLRNHDRANFEVFCYSNTPRADTRTEEVRSLVNGFRDIYCMDDEHAAEMIRADRIDILVDLVVHGGGNRLLVFARKPAPVQVTCLGDFGGTGLETMDYRLSDPYLDPPDSAPGAYSEETIRLPRCTWCYEPAGPTPEVSPLPALKAGFITFACRNRFTKISTPTLDLWWRILREVPGSRLVLNAPAGSCREKLLDQAERNDVSPERLRFPGRESWREFVQSYEAVDLALDPFPYNGWLTTCDALWMGVPVISLIGQRTIARGGLSILSNAGLPELAAKTPEEYFKIAVSLAGDLPRLSALRSSLRDRMKHSPLRDAPGITRDLENVYREMWSRWCNAPR